MYTFCTKTLLLRLFVDFNEFRINKFRDFKNLSSSWFESMPEPTGTAYVSARQEERREFDSGLGIHRLLPTAPARGAGPGLARRAQPIAHRLTLYRASRIP